VKEADYSGAEQTPIDEDLDSLSREELINEAKRLRNGIRAHRDSSGHDLCWHHPDLWGLLPEKTDPLPVVPEEQVFFEGCRRYFQSIKTQLPNAPRTTIEYGGSEQGQ